MIWRTTKRNEPSKSIKRKTKKAIIPKDAIIVSEGANTMDIGRTMLLNSKARHRLDAGTFGMNSTMKINFI
jgi:hypothetical protein